MTDNTFNPEIEGPVSMFTLGAVLWDDRGRAFTYVRAGANCGQYDLVKWAPGTYSAIPASTANMNQRGEALGCPQVAIGSGNYGWVQVFGFGRARVAGAVDTDEYSYSSSTAGAIDNVSSGNIRTRNIVFAGTTSGAGVVDCMFGWPGDLRYV